MSSKPGDLATAAAGVPRSARWRPSITVQLAALYAACTVVLLLVATALLYWAVVVSIAHDDQALLTEKIHVLRTMLAERAHDAALLNEEVDWETGVLGHARYFVQILDRDGHPLDQTPGMAQAGIGPGAFPAPIPLTAATPQPTAIRTAGGHRYLLAAALARLGDGAQPRRIVRVAFDISHEDRILAGFRTIAALVLLAGVLLSAALGALVARRGLRPLKAMAHAVQETTVIRLHRRVDPAQWPRELTDLANAFNRMLAGLEHAVGRLSSYAADLAHELRTPLNNLMGETEVILAKPRSPAEYRATLESNLEEYQRLAQMIDSLLFLARAEHPTAHVHAVTLDARRELEDVADFYDAAAEDAGVRIRCDGTGALHADRDLLRRALGNLFSNAIRHTPAGGEVCATLSPLPDGGTGIAVSDTGAGIAPDEQPRVFDRFFRGHDARRRSGGSGLGLAIVRSIMELHRGTVALHSRPGQGTTVTLRFPPPGATLPGETRSPGEAPARPVRADDHGG